MSAKLIAEWRPCGCGEPECTALFVGGKYARVGTFATGEGHTQWFGVPAGKRNPVSGLERSLVAAQDMAMRECGLLGDDAERAAGVGS
jgi:hypothetical protein